MLTTRKATRSIWAALLLLPLLVVQNAVAGFASRVETKSGEIYENCDVSVDNTYRVLKLECADDSRNVSFTNVAYIFDGDGNDVTADYLGRYYQPPEAEVPSEAEPPEDTVVQPAEPAVGTERPTEGWETRTERAARPKAYQFAVHPKGMFSVPLGEYYEGITSGIGFGVEISIPVAHEYAIRLRVEKAGLSEDLADILAPLEILQDDLSFSVWRYSIAAEYYVWPNWQEGRKTSWHAWSGIGATSNSFSGSLIVRDPFTNEVGAFGTSYSETKFTMNVGGSVLQMLSSAVGLEFGVNFDLLFVGTTGNDFYYYGYDTQYASILDLRAGLTYVLR